MAKILGVDHDTQKYNALINYCNSGASLLAKFEFKYEQKKLSLPLILPKCSKIKWHKAGVSEDPWLFPLYELHAEGEPCVEHLCLKEPLYFWHNVQIPKRMGEVKSKDWESKWILDEENAEVKRILLKHLPAEKIYQELGGKTLDKYQGYELIELGVTDQIQYRYCSMRCPSTGDKYLLRVPPDVNTAHEAITWVNHGVKPEEIYMES